MPSINPAKARADVRRKRKTQHRHRAAAASQLTFVVQDADALVAGHPIHASRQDAAVLATPNDRVVVERHAHNDAREQRIFALADDRWTAGFWCFAWCFEGCMNSIGVFDTDLLAQWHCIVPTSYRNKMYTLTNGFCSNGCERGGWRMGDQWQQ